MTEATSTTSDTARRAGVVAHALHALADHIEEHHLPEPGSIEIEDHLEFHVRGDDAAVWQASLRHCVDKIATRPTHEGMEVVTVTGRLPASGVRVAVEWIRLRRSPIDYLRAVTR